MVEISVMIEGQDGLNWPRWQRLARTTEDGGFDGLFRSDHFSNPGGPYLDALEAMTSLTWLAAETKRIRFGTMVSPVSFRDPVTLAWQSNAIDSLSGGRLNIGLGAGWQEREHTSFGYDLLEVRERMDRFAEALQVVRLLTRSGEPVSFAGTYYQLNDAQMMPKSHAPEGAPITIGGAGPKRTIPLVAKYADEWNCVHMPVDRFVERNALLNEELAKIGRDAGDVRRTMMGTIFIGKDDAAVAAKLNGKDKTEVLASGQFAGTPAEIVAILQRYIDAGLDGVKLRILDLDDMASLELIAAEVIPHFR
jgi:F420-dependent oxidoreductase-like protein